MFGTYFENDSIKKMITVFGTLFNDISVKRFDDGGSTIRTIKVPLSYSPRSRITARINQKLKDASATTIDQIVPRIGFEMVAITPDSERKLTTMGQIKKSTSYTSMKTVFNPAPFIFDFELYILTKQITDGLQIVEQILPFFTPELHVTIQELPELGIKRDIPVILIGVQFTDNYEAGVQDGQERLITYILTFQMKGYLYASAADTGIIKSVDVNFLDFDKTGQYIKYNVKPNPSTAQSDTGKYTETIDLFPIPDGVFNKLFTSDFT